MYDDLSKTRVPLSFVDHIRFNYPALKILSSLDLMTIDLSPESHPDWNGEDIKASNWKKEKKIDADINCVEENPATARITTAL